jgi:hypothetical protein
MKFTGDEVLLIGLHRYSITGPLEQTMQPIFKLDFSALSRCLKIFNNHILFHHLHLITNNLEYWKPYFPMFPFVKDKKSYKIMKNKICSKYYIVATILRNAHMCLYEGLSSSYFSCPTPNLFEYFRVNQ